MCYLILEHLSNICQFPYKWCSERLAMAVARSGTPPRPWTRWTGQCTSVTRCVRGTSCTLTTATTTALYPPTPTSVDTTSMTQASGARDTVGWSKHTANKLHCCRDLLSVCLSVVSHILETSEVIAITLDTVTASVMRMHNVLIMLTLLFIQGHSWKIMNSQLFRKLLKQCPSYPSLLWR